MGNVANPVHADSDEGNKSLIELLQKLISKGPRWLKIPGILVALLIAGTPYVSMLRDYFDARKTTDTNGRFNAQMTKPDYYAGRGEQIGLPTDWHALAGTALRPDDATHLSMHTARMENPPFKKLPVDGFDGEIDYSVYQSDGCVLINHVKGGTIKSDLVRADATPARNAGKVDLRESDPLFDMEPGKLELRARIVNAVWQRQAEFPRGEQSKQPVQAGCLNPHPGQFQYWNVPVNQCSVQVFRKFADGCTHYQLYDRCRGQWDPTVHWTFCNAQHRW